MQGSVLATSAGTLTNSPTSYAYGWEDCDSSGAGCNSIPGATSSQYVVTASDEGHTIRAVVTAANAGGSSSSSSSATSVVIGPPINSVPPAIDGTPIVGQTLADGPGTWSDSPTSYSYQWQRCDSSGSSCA